MSKKIEGLERAHNAGSKSAAWSLGVIHRFEFDYKEALRWFMVDADKNKNPDAMRQIALFYEEGWGVEKSLAEADKWSNMALGKKAHPTGAVYRRFCAHKG